MFQRLTGAYIELPTLPDAATDFPDRATALAFAQRHLGADAEGRVTIIFDTWGLDTVLDPAPPVDTPKT